MLIFVLSTPIPAICLLAEGERVDVIFRRGRPCLALERIQPRPDLGCESLATVRAVSMVPSVELMSKAPGVRRRTAAASSLPGSRIECLDTVGDRARERTAVTRTLREKVNGGADRDHPGGSRS